MHMRGLRAMMSHASCQIWRCNVTTLQAFSIWFAFGRSPLWISFAVVGEIQSKEKAGRYLIVARHHSCT